MRIDNVLVLLLSIEDVLDCAENNVRYYYRVSSSHSINMTIGITQSLSMERALKTE